MSNSITTGGLRFDAKPHGVEVVRVDDPTRDEILGMVTWDAIERIRAVRPNDPNLPRYTARCRRAGP